HASPTFQDYVALGHRFRRVISSLGMKIRFEFADEGAHVWLGKDYHRIHVAERCQNLGALFRRNARTSLAFDYPDRFIRIQSDEWCRPSSNPWREAVAVPRFITTLPPAT